MEKVIRKFDSPEQAETRDREFYRSLTPEQRLEILLELIENSTRGTAEGFERVYRVVELQRR